MPPLLPWVSNLNCPASMVVLGDYMYVADVTGGAIDKITVSTGAVQKGWVTGLSAPTGMAADDTYLYFGNSANTIYRIEINNPTQKIEFASFPDHVLNIALKGDYLYVPSYDGKLYRVAKNGGAKVEWSTTSGQTRAVTFVGNDLYLCNNDGAIDKISSATGATAPTVITRNIFSALGTFGRSSGWNLVSDGTYLYAVKGSEDSVAKINVATATIEASFTSGQPIVYGDIYVYNKCVYIAQQNKNAIYKIDIPVLVSAIYLGKAIVTEEGNMSFGSAILTTDKLPSDPHHLVPKGYVDKYNADILAYLTKVLDGNNLNDLLTRLSLVEEQLDRSYKAIWNLPRDTPAIRTEQNPNLTINGHLADADNAAMIANVPTPPTNPSAIGTGFIN